MESGGDMVALVKLKAIEATPESFQDFGQVVEAHDGHKFGPADAQLDLSHGDPRFYLMHLEESNLGFSDIVHHANVTQCLGSIGARVWYLGVAKPSVVEDDGSSEVMKSQSGHFYAPPSVDDVRVFRISGAKFVKLNRGTWHAGPLFKDGSMDFYNLELTNTNAVDRTVHNFVTKNNVSFILDE